MSYVKPLGLRGWGCDIAASYAEGILSRGLVASKVSIGN